MSVDLLSGPNQLLPNSMHSTVHGVKNLNSRLISSTKPLSSFSPCFLPHKATEVEIFIFHKISISSDWFHEAKLNRLFNIPGGCHHFQCEISSYNVSKHNSCLLINRISIYDLWFRVISIVKSKMLNRVRRRHTWLNSFSFVKFIKYTSSTTTTTKFSILVFHNQWWPTAIWVVYLKPSKSKVFFVHQCT